MNEKFEETLIEAVEELLTSSGLELSVKERLQDKLDELKDMKSKDKQKAEPNVSSNADDAQGDKTHATDDVHKPSATASPVAASSPRK